MRDVKAPKQALQQPAHAWQRPWALTDAWTICRLLYVLAFLQFTMSSFYEPAKRALTPLLVAPEDLHLATTLDSFAWSLMGAVGASFGGWFASRFGTAACFALDACSYIVAALCAIQLKVCTHKNSKIK